MRRVSFNKARAAVQWPFYLPGLHIYGPSAGKKFLHRHSRISLQALYPFASLCRLTEFKDAELLAKKTYNVSLAEEQEKASEQTHDTISQKEEEEAKDMPFVCSGYTLSFQDAVALVSSLKHCTHQRDLSKGILLHANFCSRGLLNTNIFIANTLINLYVKCGALARARDVFDEHLFPNVVSWNALLAGYAQHGHWKQALGCFDGMQHQGLAPDAVTFSLILKACGSIRALKKGKEVHAEIVMNGILESDVVLGTALVDMYAKCGDLAKAQQSLDELPLRNTASWNALMTGYCQHGQAEMALNCLKWMKHDAISPNAVTFVCILKACSSVGAREEGQAFHTEIVKGGLIGNNMMLGSALVDMYAKCGALPMAQQVFNELRVRDIISWTGMIAGYCQHEHNEEALKSFEQLKCEGLSPNAITFACILKACGKVGAAGKGRDIHAEILRKGSMGNDTVLGSALADMYAKCGAFLRAREVFDGLLDRDVVSWNALIAGYCKYRDGEEALQCFESMKCEDLTPNAATFACVLKACGSLGAAEKGKGVHAEIARKGLLETSSVLGNALVDMYAKCGMLGQARKLFEELPIQDIVSWNTLIAGFCKHGHCKEALECFERMKNEGLFPDEVTFACALRACSSIGAADKGQLYFETISTACGITPSLEHHTCMVDLFGRAGHLDRAMSVAKKVPSSDDYSAWFTLLGSCQALGNVKLARTAFEHAVRY